MTTIKWSSNKDENAPLTPIEQLFIKNYIATGIPAQALKDTGIRYQTNSTYSIQANKLLAKPNIKAEIDRIMSEVHDATVAEAEEVMRYFTAVMRGEIKDQFGLDASLSERTKAAQEIAKRTVDIENREAGKADQAIQIRLDWKR